MGMEIVVLKVGPPGSDKMKTFMVHKKLLCDKVPYFSKMFSGTWKESKDGVAEFPEDSAEMFDLLVCWVYKDAVRLVLFSQIYSLGFNSLFYVVLSYTYEVRD